jgi:hypothetical protein
MIEATLALGAALIEARVDLPVERVADLRGSIARCPRPERHRQCRRLSFSLKARKEA